MLAFIPAPPTNGFHLGPLFFHLYGLCIAIGVLAGRSSSPGLPPASTQRRLASQNAASTTS